jgi:hypothetical protein
MVFWAIADPPSQADTANATNTRHDCKDLGIVTLPNEASFDSLTER